MSALDPEQYEPFPPFAGWCDDFDPSTVDRFAALLEQARVATTPEAMEAAVRVQTRYAAVDTGAIEGLYQTNRGFTRTIAEQTATWQAALKQHGEHVERSIEDALNGYEMVLDLVKEKGPVTETWIRQLHETICGSQDVYTVHTAIGTREQTFPKGVYKDLPNNPTNPDTGREFHYAPPADTPAEMNRLVEELRSEAFASAHSVLQASYAHYAFVRVHPFADGNGRVSRALAAIYLYRSPGVPLVIFTDQKDQYLDALEAADVGDPLAFVQFVGERAIDTIELIRAGLAGAGGRTAEALSQLSGELNGRGGLDHTQYDVLNERIATLVGQALPETFEEFDTPTAMTLRVQKEHNSPRPPEGYRSAGRHYAGFSLNFQQAIHAERSRNVDVWSALPDTEGADFLVVTKDHPPLEVFIRDVSPAETEVLRLKIRTWLSGLLNVDLSAFSAEIRAKMVQSGYLR